MPDFKDYFSKQSDIYARYRPQYPRELYAWLASLTKGHNTAWDCGTGNGQAAVGLAEFYDKIIATDPSEQQIRSAVPHERVEYRVEKAENTSIPSHSVDLITVANALHWFNFDAFYSEVRRVLKPGGILAAWCYVVPAIEPEIDRITMAYHNETLGSYWLPENWLVKDEYKDLPFPFEEIEAPQFYSHKNLNLDNTIGYFNTWSATQRFIERNGYNPTEELKDQLKPLWPDETAEKTLTWKLILKAGRV